MIVKVKSSGEILEGREWDGTNHFKPWPPDERIFSMDDVEIIEK